MNARELVELFDDEMTKLYILALESDDSEYYYLRHESYFDFIRSVLLMVHRARGNHEKIVSVKERLFNNEAD